MSRAVLSVDVESFTHTPAYRSAEGTTDERGVGLEGVEFLLETLAEHDERGTFFVVSELAEEYPASIAAVAERGHEIGSHTHTHRLLTDLDAGQRRDELSRSRECLREVTGTAIEGFRAPAFEFAPDHFETLAETGYRYDSSVAPCRYIPGWYGGDYSVRRPALASRFDPDAPPDFVEVPVGVMPGLRLPLTGAWIRFFGVRYTTLGMRLLAREGIAPVLYVHPWELVDLPRVTGVPERVYWRTGEWMRRALKRLLAQPFDFVTIRQIVEHEVER